jgi:hypothetical protein
MLLVANGTKGEEPERTTDGRTGGLAATRGGTSDLRRENRGILFGGYHEGGEHRASGSEHLICCCVCTAVAFAPPLECFHAIASSRLRLCDSVIDLMADLGMPQMD